MCSHILWISEFIQYRLEELREMNGHLGDHWPSDDDIASLAKRAGGLFIWASTACRYIDSYAPKLRLSELVNNQLERNSSKRFAQLDSLYEICLRSAGLWNDPSFCSDCRNVLGVILCARVPLSYSDIDALLELPSDTPSCELVSRLGCVLYVSKSEQISAT